MSTEDPSFEDQGPICAEEVREVLAELGVELTAPQAVELARLLELTGSVDEALAALVKAERRAA